MGDNMKNQAIFILLGFLVITACGENHKKSAEQDEPDDPFGDPSIATCINDTDCGPNQLCMVGTCINKINKKTPDIGVSEPEAECTINYHCSSDKECVDGGCVAKATDDEEDDEESDDDEDDDKAKPDCLNQIIVNVPEPYKKQKNLCDTTVKTKMGVYLSDETQKASYEKYYSCQFLENYSDAELVCPGNSEVKEQDTCEQKLATCLGEKFSVCQTYLEKTFGGASCTQQLTICSAAEDLDDTVCSGIFEPTYDQL